jgi:hypothetical protein
MAAESNRKAPKERLEARILFWAMAFCKADNRFQQEWPQWRNLLEEHFPFAPCFEDQQQAGDADDPYAVDARPALPRSKWCRQCIDFIDSGSDYKEALYERRTAKAYMKRAFKALSRMTS